ncbi:MAG: SHOCT domain-containing protein [Solirubrobacteraceae bacterium]
MPVRAPHRHRLLIATLLIVATIFGIGAINAVWINRQALNTENWTNTSTQLLANKEIQAAVAAYAVNQLFSSGIVEDEIKNALSVLPKPLAPLEALAGPAASGLQQLAGQVAPKLLASSQVQTAWRVANHAAHATLMKIINGGGKLASTSGGVVTLNLHAIISQLASALGVQQQVAAVVSKLKANAGTVRAGASQVGITLPPASGQLVIMRSSELKTAQDIAADIKGLALWLPVLTLALFALAVYLSRGRRRAALRMVGWCFVGAGVFTLLDRRIAGNYVIDALVKNPDNKPAAHQVWTIATTMLYDIGVAVVVYGLLVVIAAWIAGHTRPATALRRVLAPTLRERPAAVYVTVYMALLLVILWGPTPATRQIAYIIGFIVLLGLGVHALRRQTAREFPEAHAGDTGRALHAWFSARRRGAVPVAASAGPGGAGGRVVELERLAQLHDRGSLTDAEFAAEKAALTNAS